MKSLLASRSKEASAPRYVHDALPNHTSHGLHIRLLSLQPGSKKDPLRCRIETIRIQDAESNESYEALSYCWGDPTHIATIYVEQAHGVSQLPLHKSLHKAFISLRLTDKVRRLWTDAICINQEDQNEKSVQVRAMYEIYRAATRAVVYLETPSPKPRSWRPKSAFYLVERCYDWSVNQPDKKFADRSKGMTKQWYPLVRNNTRRILQSMRKRGFKSCWQHVYTFFGSSEALRLLLTCSWFTRMWIIQEVACSKEAILVCEDGSSMDFKRFIIGMKYGLDKTFIRAIEPTSVKRFQRNPTSFSAAVQMESIRTGGSNSEDGLFEYLTRLTPSQCGDARDKIFALYGISQLPSQKRLATDFQTINLIPDYQQTTLQLYISTATSILGSGKMNLLSRPVKATHTQLPLPSWAPDWSARSSSISLGSLATCLLWKATKQSTYKASFSGNTCILSGCHFRTVQATGVRAEFLDFVRHISQGRYQKQQIIGWFMQWQEAFGYWESYYFPSIPSTAERIYPFTGQPLWQVYWNTFLGARSAYQSQWFRSAEDQSTSVLRGSREEHEAAMKNMANVNRRWQKPSKTVSDYVMSNLLWHIPGYIALHNILKLTALDLQMFEERNLFATADGVFGVGPVDTMEGDEIVLIKGCSVPLILRPKLRKGSGEGQEEKVYELVGDAYIHGIMRGEAFDEEKCVTVLSE